jgi:hypothetical protein
VFNPIVAGILVLTALLMFFLPQRKALIPFLFTAFLIPEDQVLVIGGLHFPILRLLILFGMVRIFVIKGRGEWNIFSNGVSKLDKAFIALSVTTAAAGVLLFHDSQAVIFQFGGLYDAFGAYFLLRCFIRDRADVVRVMRALALIVVVLGAIMMFEQRMNGWNPYTLLGGARARAYAVGEERDGKTRAMGSFAQPIIAGTFGAVTLPLFLGLWLTEKKSRPFAAIGVAGACTMVVACNSFTPMFGLMGGIIGLCLWPMRSFMRVIRWGIVAGLIALQMVMNGPIWSIITHLDISGSSYHRYQLIDQCIHHFWDWWLVGTASNANWGWDMWDTANQYVQTAQNSGLLAFSLLIAVIVYGFKYLGNARKATTDKNQALLLWALGSALFAQLMSFLGISLWDQSIVGWYALLAFIGAVAGPNAQAAEQVEAAEGAELDREMQPAFMSISRRRLLEDREDRGPGNDEKLTLHHRRAKEF